LFAFSSRRRVASDTPLSGKAQQPRQEKAMPASSPALMFIETGDRPVPADPTLHYLPAGHYEYRIVPTTAKSPRWTVATRGDAC
jgi:hypothetical protein